MDEDHGRFMDLALDLARQAVAAGDWAFGAVIVRDGRLVAAGRNTAATSGVPLHHAEMMALLNACRDGRRADLAGATLYATMEPCPMCLWAIVESGIARLVLGGRHAERDDGGVGDVGGYTVERLLALSGRRLDVITGIRTEACGRLEPRWPARFSGHGGKG